MSDIKTYTAIVLIPKVVEVARADLAEAELAFKKYVGEQAPDNSYVMLDNDGNVVTFSPRLSFIQEGNLHDEQVDRSD